VTFVHADDTAYACTLCACLHSSYYFSQHSCCFFFYIVDLTICSLFFIRIPFFSQSTAVKIVIFVCIFKMIVLKHNKSFVSVPTKVSYY
jgi:hypothetical protein